MCVETMDASGKKILVACAGRAKVLTINEDGISNLAREFYAAFGVSEAESLVTFQRYCPDFEDFIDIEGDCELYHKEKLNAVLTPYYVRYQVT